MERAAILCLFLAGVSTTMFIVENRRGWHNNQNEKQYGIFAALTWSLSFALGCSLGWWQYADIMLIVAVGLTVAALFVNNDHEARVIALVFAIVSLEAWQDARWHYGGWQLAAAVLSAGVIPPLACLNIEVWPEIWREHKARRLPEAAGLNIA